VSPANLVSGIFTLIFKVPTLIKREHLFRSGD
jgi:hypothetical protein